MIDHTTLRIGAIDPGITTGVAIADVQVYSDYVVLQKRLLLSTLQPLEVTRFVIRQQCYSVVLERRPMYASREGTEHYEAILQHLLLHEYKDHKHWIFEPMTLCLFSPGIWKPVMKAQNITERGNWCPESQHEKDALNMLHYAVKLNYMSREIQYG